MDASRSSPSLLDAESRALISRFAELNPMDPTDD